MSAYFGTWRVVSALPVPPEVLALARKIVGQMLELQVESHRLELGDGTVILANTAGDVPKVTIVQAVQRTRKSIELTDLWVPRGFVVYPAFHGARGGFGLPIIQDTDHGPYAPENLAPGLDTSRWTAGGPCGEVLISQDKEAGYPVNRDAIVVPLLYDTTLGPVFQWTGKGAYDARPADGAWTPYRMELDPPIAHYSDESVPSMTDMFDAVNGYRVANGATALTLQPRGYYHAAQVMVSIMQATGTTDAYSLAYPEHYQTATDRLTKDGFSATVMGSLFTGFARGDTPVAFEVRQLGGSAAAALEVWKADPVSDGILLQPVGNAAFADIGNRAGYWAVNVISRSSWIAAGNCSWTSDDQALPPLSWHGFASVNLAWETYPATYDIDNYTTAPLVPSMAFTNANGDCWLNYPRNGAPTVADIEPGMSRHIYTRGRAIALAPRGGLVWGASFIANGTADRLIALVHHPEDQPGDYTTNGWTRYLRVWWCDIPSRPGLRGDPQLTITGEAMDDPWGWKGGDLVDVGHMPPPSTGGTVPDGATSSLKYASQWRFNSDGSRAVCLRDFGVYTDYSSLYGVVGIQTKTGMYPRAVELSFTVDESSTITNTIWHDYTPGAFLSTRAIAAPLDVSDDPGTPVYEHGVVPTAVDYGQGNSLVYAFTGEIASFNEVGDIVYSYVGIGTEGTEYPSDLLSRRLHGAALRTPGSDFRPSGVIVADVTAAAFVLEGVRPRINMADGQETGAACYPFTDLPVHGVRMVRAGYLLDESWYPAPDGAVFSLASVCDSSVGSSAVLVELPLAASRNVQAYHAQRFGETVFSTQVAPVAQALLFLDAPPSDDSCGCRMDIQRVADASHLMAFNEWNPRGGHAVSSVGLPDNDWLIYSKVV